MPHYYEQPCEHAGATPFCPCGNYRKVLLKGTVIDKLGLYKPPPDHDGWFLVIPVEKVDWSTTA